METSEPAQLSALCHGAVKIELIEGLFCLSKHHVLQQQMNNLFLSIHPIHILEDVKHLPSRYLLHHLLESHPFVLVGHGLQDSFLNLAQVAPTLFPRSWENHDADRTRIPTGSVPEDRHSELESSGHTYSLDSGDHHEDLLFGCLLS